MAWTSLLGPVSRGSKRAIEKDLVISLVARRIVSAGWLVVCSRCRWAPAL